MRDVRSKLTEAKITPRIHQAIITVMFAERSLRVTSYVHLVPLAFEVTLVQA